MHRTHHPARAPHDGPRRDHPGRLATFGHDHGARRLRRRRRRHHDARSHLDPPECGGPGEGAGPGARPLLHREQVMDLLWPDESPPGRRPGCTGGPLCPPGGRPPRCRRPAGRRRPCSRHGPHRRCHPVRGAGPGRPTGSRPPRGREALAWYGGELLPGDLYEDWASDRREMLLAAPRLLRVAGEWRRWPSSTPPITRPTWSWSASPPRRRRRPARVRAPRAGAGAGAGADGATTRP
jgi:hypothetical protein